MAAEWHDINEPGYGRKKDSQPQKAAPSGVEDDGPSPRQKPDVEYRIKSVNAVEPAQGFEKRKPFDIAGEVELIRKISRARVLLHPIGIYNGVEQDLAPGGVEAFIDPATLKFKGTCRCLITPKAFNEDTQKPADATWQLVIRAEGNTAESSFESGPMTFPRPSRFVTLQKGHYDENGARKYGKPQQGEDYKPHEVVKALQKDLITTLFLPKDSDDGFFGDQTDKAVREFQDFAIKDGRMKRGVGKVEKTEQKLAQAQPDGVVGKMTRDELDRWLKNDWVRPLPSLREGDIDDKGVELGKGKPGSDPHHINTPVLDAQKKLEKMDAYAGAQDGWFGDKMKDAITLLQECAEKGQFLIDGVLTDIGEKLGKYVKGTLGPETQEYMKKVEEKKGKVYREIHYGGYELTVGDNDKLKKWAGQIRTEDGKFVAELQEDLFGLGYWISKGLMVPSIGQPMVYDGDFGKGLFSGLKTFQYEHKDALKLKATGKLDKDTASAIKKCVADKKFKRPGIPIKSSDMPDGVYCSYANNKPAKPTRLYQLPPSPEHLYKRYGEISYPTGGELGDVYHNDAWGARETIDALIALSKVWRSEKDVLEIGDISAWNAVDIGHETHRDGHGVDIRSEKVGAMNMYDKTNPAYDKDKSVSFAQKAIAIGFKYILTRCPHVTKECNSLSESQYVYVNQVSGHHHHFHMDFWPDGSKIEDEHISRAYCGSCGLASSCNSEHKQKG